MKIIRVMFSLMLAVVLVSSVPARAQSGSTPLSAGDWSKLSSMARGVELVVKLKSGKTVKGRLSHANDTTLILERKGRTTDIASADVSTVHRIVGKSSKAKWAGIGAGVGAAGGAGLAAAVSADESNDLDIALVALLTVPVGAGVGALVGTVIGASKRKRELVYEAKTAAKF